MFYIIKIPHRKNFVFQNIYYYMDFKNKVVLFTGASSGIGEASAIQFATKIGQTTSDQVKDPLNGEFLDYSI